MTDKEKEQICRWWVNHELRSNRVTFSDKVYVSTADIQDFEQFIDSLQEESKPKFKVGQTITDPTDSTFTFHINKIEDGRYIEKEDEWVLVKEADANYKLVEEPVSEDMEDYHNMAKIGIVVGLLSIPVASMTNRFGFGQIPQLLGGIMAIGGALMAINHIMFDDK